MLKVQRILSVASCTAHLVFGLSILFRFGPVGQSPAWSVLSEIWSDYGSPIAFLLIAAFAAVGFVERRALQVSLYAGAIVVWIWSLGLWIAWYVGYGPQPGALWLIWIGVLKWCVAYFWLAYEKQAAAIDQLSNQVARTVHQSQRGIDAGDLGEN